MAQRKTLSIGSRVKLRGLNGTDVQDWDLGVVEEINGNIVVVRWFRDGEVKSTDIGNLFVPQGMRFMNEYQHDKSRDLRYMDRGDIRENILYRMNNEAKGYGPYSTYYRQEQDVSDGNKDRG